jgi:hypothetical protein
MDGWLERLHSIRQSLRSELPPAKRTKSLVLLKSSLWAPTMPSPPVLPEERVGEVRGQRQTATPFFPYGRTK